MFKSLIVATVLSAGLVVLVGCSNAPTASKTSERTEFVGHLEAATDKAVTLRNPNNGHMKTFALTDKTVIEVDGVKADKLPAPVKNDTKNCRVHIVVGTNNATKIELRTKQ